MEEKRFFSVDDVAEYMGVSVPTAYKLIRRLNDELREDGYLTVSGKVSRNYFERRTCGSARG